MKRNALLFSLALAMVAGPMNAAALRSAKDTLSADGPYILYRQDGGARIITVDPEGNISDQSYDRLPENYTFQVTDHQGKYPFQVTLRPFSREPWRIPGGTSRTFVMSDPHGRLDCVVSLLQGNGVIDSDLHWSYGTDRLVVIGDIFDRGNDVTAIYWLFYKLQQEAREAGGSVSLLLGNHEAMEISGDQRYAKPKYLVLARELGLAYKDLMGPASELGRWIATWNTIGIIGDNLYVHAGIGKDFYDWNLPIPEVNDKISGALFMKNADRKRQSDTLSFLYGSYGPIWFRGLVMDEPSRRPVSLDTLDLIRQRYVVNRIIVGHTIFRDVSTFYQGRVIDVNVDNAVNRRKRRGRALLIENGQYFIVGDKGKQRRIQ
jgi:hypothetical protein